jgi:preprotein translocase subunit YajC
MQIGDYYLLFKLKKKSDYKMYIFFAFIFFIIIFSTFIAYIGSSKKKYIKEESHLLENIKDSYKITTPHVYRK